LCEGGIIAIDDLLNHLVPGVLEGVAEFFIRCKPALAPFAYCFNKLFVTTPDYHERYLSESRSFLQQVTWLRTHERSLQVLKENQANGFVPKLFGYEIVSFEY
jgi:hypothetical protein